MISITKSDDQGFDVLIGTSSYRFDTSNGYPVIFSRNSRLSVPNVDGWCLSQTQGKFSYREIQLMAEAYKYGYNNGLKDRNLPVVEKEYCVGLLKTIFEDGFIDDLSDIYWIECTQKSHFITKLVPFFIRDFENLRKKYGDSGVRNYLNRIRIRLEILNQSDLLQVIKKLIGSLHGDVVEPIYPDVKNIAESIINTYRIKEPNESNSALT